jgi:large subunit ribosomal protein L25
MKTLEIIGFKRANLGKKESADLRANSLVPCVLYGGKEQVHFSVPMILFRDLLYTPEVSFVKLNVEGDIYECVIQDSQFHPVNEMILHADFLLLDDKKPLKMDIPVKLEGTAPGVTKGGKIFMKKRTVKLKALPKDMPDFVVLDVTSLDFGKTLRVGDIPTGKYQTLENPSTAIVGIEIPRALRGKTAEA